MTVFDIVYQDPQYYPRPTAFLFDRLPSDLTGQRVLDVGCGNGRNALELLRRGATVMATDPSVTGIEALRKQAEVEGIDQRLRTYGTSVPLLPPALLDGVVLSTVLDHMDPTEADQALAAIAPSLRTDAWTYASVFTLEDPGRTGRSESETNSGVVTYWDPLEFALKITQQLDCHVVSLSVDWMIDDSHGPRHLHHLLRLFATKGEPLIRRIVDL